MGELVGRVERRKHPCPKCGWTLNPRRDEDVRIVETRERHDDFDTALDEYYHFRARIYRRFTCNGKHGCGWKGRWTKTLDTITPKTETKKENPPSQEGE